MNSVEFERFKQDVRDELDKFKVEIRDNNDKKAKEIFDLKKEIACVNSKVEFEQAEKIIQLNKRMDTEIIRSGERSDAIKKIEESVELTLKGMFGRIEKISDFLKSWGFKGE